MLTSALCVPTILITACALWVLSQAPVRWGVLNCCNQLFIYTADLPGGTFNSAGNDISSKTGNGKI